MAAEKISCHVCVTPASLCMDINHSLKIWTKFVRDTSSPLSPIRMDFVTIGTRVMVVPSNSWGKQLHTWTKGQLEGGGGHCGTLNDLLCDSSYTVLEPSMDYLLAVISRRWFSLSPVDGSVVRCLPAHSYSSLFTQFDPSLPPPSNPPLPYQPPPHHPLSFSTPGSLGDEFLLNGPMR